MALLTLILLRHAKATQSASDDFARDLTPEGVVAARLVGDSLRERDLAPDLAVVSTAARTRRTFEAVEATCGSVITARFTDALYNATEQQIREGLHGIGRDTARVLVVGHNPGIMACALAMATSGAEADIARLRERFPPCAYAVLSFEVDAWADVDSGRLDLFVLPEDLKGRG